MRVDTGRSELSKESRIGRTKDHCSRCDLDRQQLLPAATARSLQSHRPYRD